MAAPPIVPTVAPSPDLNLDKNTNLVFQNTTTTAKVAYFKFGTSSSTTDTVMEIITKDPNEIEVSDKIPVSTSNSYYVNEIDKTPVKFASGTPLVTQTTNIRFPTPEARAYTPEKVATFLIFKK